MEYKMVGLYKDKFSGLCSKFSTWSDFQGHENIIKLIFSDTKQAHAII